MIQCSGPEQPKLSPKIPIEKLQAGDIAFRRGESIASEVVLYNDIDGRYSHVGLVVETDSGLMVAHSVPGKTSTQETIDVIQIEHINHFFEPKVSVRGEIMRMNLDSVQRHLLNILALKKVDDKVPFDHNYDLSDTTKLYCTELLQLLFKNIGIDLAQGRITPINVPGLSNNYIMPSDIYNNNNLKTIFYY
jgi:hypothetical protein